MQSATNQARGITFTHQLISNWSRLPIRSDFHSRIIILFDIINSFGNAPLHLFLFSAVWLPYVKELEDKFKWSTLAATNWVCLHRFGTRQHIYFPTRWQPTTCRPPIWPTLRRQSWHRLATHDAAYFSYNSKCVGRPWLTTLENHRGASIGHSNSPVGAAHWSSSSSYNNCLQFSAIYQLSIHSMPNSGSQKLRPFYMTLSSSTLPSYLLKVFRDLAINTEFNMTELVEASPSATALASLKSAVLKRYRIHS